MVKEWLRRFPHVFGTLRTVYRRFGPKSKIYTRLQAAIDDALEGKPDVFFVQIGSNDGQQGDPLNRMIFRNPKWRGVFVEPVPHIFARLCQHYGRTERFSFENLAIGQASGGMTFYHVSERAKAELGESLPYWYDQLGSFERSHIVKHLEGRLEPFIVESQVEVVSLTGLLDKHAVARVDLLHIDAEGFDYEVLASLDFSRYLPSVILLEHKHLSVGQCQALYAMLESHDYQWCRYGNDTLAVLPHCKRAVALPAQHQDSSIQACGVPDNTSTISL